MLFFFVISLPFHLNNLHLQRHYNAFNVDIGYTSLAMMPYVIQILS